jgi:mono/diheme cytochrome c family protein
MKKTALLLATLILVAPMALYADGAATFNAKCKMCHGADGKKIAKADFAEAEADLVKFVLSDAKHKTKVPDEATAKEVVAYIKALRK